MTYTQENIQWTNQWIDSPAVPLKYRSEITDDSMFDTGFSDNTNTNDNNDNAAFSGGTLFFLVCDRSNSGISKAWGREGELVCITRSSKKKKHILRKILSPQKKYVFIFRHNHLFCLFHTGRNVLFLFFSKHVLFFRTYKKVKKKMTEHEKFWRK